mmetsp:Transcript_60838/g.101093  ORF Transcript_60838/g.101093 Transcript_60838/m.101093 type:complete len:224 (-) Transcript_60838:373-1044(-)
MAATYLRKTGPATWPCTSESIRNGSPTWRNVAQAVSAPSVVVKVFLPPSSPTDHPEGITPLPRWAASERPYTILLKSYPNLPWPKRERSFDCRISAIPSGTAAFFFFSEISPAERSNQNETSNCEMTRPGCVSILTAFETTVARRPSRPGSRGAGSSKAGSAAFSSRHWSAGSLNSSSARFIEFAGAGTTGSRSCRALCALSPFSSSSRLRVPSNDDALKALC